MKRLAASFKHDVLIQYRYGLYAVSLFVVLIWGVLLSLLAGTLTVNPDRIVPAFIAFNLIVTTFYFMAALILLEKDQGMFSAFATTPLRDHEILLSKGISLTLLGVAESLMIVILLFGLDFRFLPVILGSLLLGLLYTFAGLIAVVRYSSINTFLIPSAGYIILLMLPILEQIGLVPAWVFYLHPVEPSLILMRSGFVNLSVGEVVLAICGTLLWSVLAFEWARRRYRRYVVLLAGSEM